VAATQAAYSVSSPEKKKKKELINISWCIRHCGKWVISVDVPDRLEIVNVSRVAEERYPCT
jgi:hypothetical protein